MKNFNINMLPPVPAKKLGKEFKLNKDNAKILYFLEICDLNFNDKKVIEWYKENFDEETLMSWRCEYILNSIDKTYKLINKNPDINEFKEILKNIYFMLKLLIKDKEILDKEISLLVYLSNTLGDFEYGLSGEDHEFINISDGILDKKYREEVYYGFIHNLMILGYDDLIEKTLKNLIIPYIISYPNETEYMKRTGLRYLELKSMGKMQNEWHLEHYLNYFKGTKFEKLLSDVKL